MKWKLINLDILYIAKCKIVVIIIQEATQNPNTPVRLQFTFMMPNDIAVKDTSTIFWLHSSNLYK